MVVSQILEVHCGKILLMEVRKFIPRLVPSFLLEIRKRFDIWAILSLAFICIVPDGAFGLREIELGGELAVSFLLEVFLVAMEGSAIITPFQIFLLTQKTEMEFLWFGFFQSCRVFELSEPFFNRTEKLRALV